MWTWRSACGGADGGEVVQMGRLELGARRHMCRVGKMGESERGSEWRQTDRQIDLREQPEAGG